MKQLPHHWKWKTNIPQPPALMPEDVPKYLHELFARAYDEGYEQAQKDMRDALGIAEPTEVPA